MSWDRLWRPVVVVGAVYFSIFAVIAVVFRQLDVADSTLSVVGGVMAYAFIVSVLVLAYREWRRSRREGEGGAEADGRSSP